MWYSAVAMDTIEPRTLKGFRDFLPADALRRKNAVAAITAVYESFGFSPLETPALEYADVLLGKYGDEGEKMLYRFRDQGDRDVAMRYDLTVPLARVVAQYDATLPKPFKRYQVASVWRAENTQKGRFREFTQCDLDIVGSSSMLADAEVALAGAAALRRLGTPEFEIRLNNRKLLNGILEGADIAKNVVVPVIRLLDKWQKLGDETLQEQLGVLVGEEKMQTLFDLLPTDDEGADFTKWVKRVEKPLAKTRDGQAGLDELLELITLLDEAKEDVFRVDVTLARGLDYYTGTILEAVLVNQPEFGSVFGGGRYDKLVGMFSGRDIPAVGASAGLDRLLAAMEEGKKDDDDAETPRSSTADVLITNMDERFVPEMLSIGRDLREKGINVEQWYEPARLEKQFRYADTQGIPLAILLGSNEKKKGVVAVKDLRTKKQELFARGTLANEVKELLGK